MFMKWKDENNISEVKPDIYSQFWKDKSINSTLGNNIASVIEDQLLTSVEQNPGPSTTSRSRKAKKDEKVTEDILTKPKVPRIHSPIINYEEMILKTVVEEDGSTKCINCLEKKQRMKSHL